MHRRAVLPWAEQLAVYAPPRPSPVYVRACAQRTVVRENPPGVRTGGPRRRRRVLRRRVSSRCVASRRACRMLAATLLPEQRRLWAVHGRNAPAASIQRRETRDASVSPRPGRYITIVCASFVLRFPERNPTNQATPSPLPPIFGDEYQLLLEGIVKIDGQPETRK